MKRVTVLIAMLALVATSCGLKVPATLTAGSNPELGTETGTGPQTGNLPGATGPSVTGPNASGPGGPGTSTGPSGPGGVAGSSLFPLETEGVTRDTLRLCTHVPITGAAPIPHAPERFGQFYFNYVNDLAGPHKGVYGRRVIFDAINDNYNPAGARNAMEQCAKKGAFMYLGAAGTDQIVSVAKWAERRKVPYLHGPTSDRDLGGLHYNIHAGPTYEHQHRLLAQYLVKRFGKDKKYFTIKVDSPFFDAGANAFRAEMKRLGVTMPADYKVQKDDSTFASLWQNLAGVDVVNNFTTPSLWIRMLNQKPPGVDPWWTAVSPVAGFNIVAQALSAGGKAVVFHHFGPACECATYKDEEISQHKDLPWYSDIQEFLRIFKKYSKEQDPPPDDFDYSAYLTAKAVHRLLLAIGPQPTRTKLWTLLKTYKEDPKKTFPGCGADYTRNDMRMGAWRVNVFELKQQNGAGVWSQNHPQATCIDSV